jgi:hypothetical protein
VTCELKRGCFGEQRFEESPNTFVEMLWRKEQLAEATLKFYFFSWLAW